MDNTNMLSLITVPMTSDYLTGVLKNDIQPIVSKTSEIRSKYISRSISKLMIMKEKAQTLENKAYELFGVEKNEKGLEQLQKKIDEINESGLSALSNEVLNKMPAIKKSREAIVSMQEVRDAITEDILKSVDYDSLTDYARAVGIEEFVERVSEFEKTLKLRKGSLLKIDATEIQKKIIVNFQKISKSRKKKIIQGLQIKPKTSVQKEDGFKTEIDFIYDEEKEEETNRLQYYPYFRLSKEEKETAKKDAITWDLFVKAVGRCIGGQYQTIVESTMRSIGVGAFVDTSDSYADIVGILGELQGLVILKILTNNSSTANFLAHAVNKKGQKVGVDLTLEDVGIQVKNYHMLGERGNDQFINLDGEYTLQNFLDLVFQRTGIDKEAISRFYAYSAYHIAVSESFGGVRQWMDTIQSQRLPDMYHGAIAELLPLKEISWIEKSVDENEIAASGRSTNVFYLIGGSRILPVSKILSVYIKFLQDLQENISNPPLLKMGENGGVIYKGKTYKDYYENPLDSSNFSGYTEISKNIKIRYNIHMNIDYSIKEILSKKLI